MRRSSAAVKGRKAKVAAKATAAEAAASSAKSAAQRAAELRASELADRARLVQALAAEQARGAQAKGAEFADLARERVRDAHLEERAAELAGRLKESEAARRAVVKARETSDQTLEKVAAWLVTTQAGQKLVATSSRRRFPLWLAALVGLAAGYAAARLTAPREPDAFRDEFAASADRLAPPPPPASPSQSTTGLDSVLDESPAAAAQAGTADLTVADTDLDAESLETPLADRVRTSLDTDPRTRALPGLAINVAERTVFVRGNVPAGTDEAAIRDVVAAVPGVDDVDLQVTTAS